MNFIAAVTVFYDFGPQENKICYCFHFFPIYLPWSDGIGCHDVHFLNVEFYARIFTLLFHPHQEVLCVLCLVAPSCPTLSNTMDCSPPGSLSMGILHSGILEWVSMTIFPAQGSNPGLLHCRQILYCLSHRSWPRGSFIPLYFQSLGWYHLHSWGCWYSSRQSWFQLGIHPGWLLMMYSAYKLNNQGDNIQPWCTPFPTWNQSVVTCLVLTVASWPEHRFLRRQVRWPDVPISLKGFYILLFSTQSKFLAYSMKQK